MNNIGFIDDVLGEGVPAPAPTMSGNFFDQILGADEMTEFKRSPKTPGKDARGVRNNNPGNIRHGSSDWQGMSKDQPDEEFVKFDSPAYGVRAVGKILLNYQTRHKLNTVQGIINRWAPPVENDTKSYVKAVAEHLGVSPTDKLDLKSNPEMLRKLIEAITNHENGYQPYDPEVLDEGIAMVLGNKKVG